MKPINMKSACAAYRKKYSALDRWRYSIDEKNARFCSVAEQKRREDEKNEAIKAYDAEIRTSKLAGELAEIQKRSIVRTIDVNAVVETLVEIEDTLDISKKAMEGITVHVDRNAQTFPSAYKYRPESTHFDAIYKAGSWRITNVCRDTTLRESQRITIHHTEASKAAILDRFTSWG